MNVKIIEICFLKLVYSIQGLKHRRMGQGGTGGGGHVPLPKFLRLGKKQCKMFVFSRKLRDVRGNFVICPENFFGRSGKIFW